MKVCITNKYGEWDFASTGKGFFVQRLLKEFDALGIKSTCDPSEKVDVDMQISHGMYWPKNARKRILRRGPVKYDTNMPYKKSNHEDNKYMKQCHGIVYQSGYSKRLNDTFLAPATKEQKTAIIFNGAEPSNYNWDMGTETMVFLAATREWVWEKRLKDIIIAFAEADIPMSKLVVAGIVWDKPKRFPPFQKNFVEKYGKRVTFLGECHESLPMLLRSTMALLHAVYIDAMPNMIAEAICAGTPIVCTDQGGQVEVVKQCNAGIVVKDQPYGFGPVDRRDLPRLNVPAYAQAMRDICSFDRSKIDKTPVLISTVAKQYAEFFERVLNN